MKKFQKKTKKKQKEKKKESSSDEETKNIVKYEINEDILDSSSFSEYEFESLKDEIKIMLKEIKTFLMIQKICPTKKMNQKKT